MKDGKQQRRETNRDAGGDRLWPKVLIVLAFLMGLNGCFHDTVTGPRCSPPVALRDSVRGVVIGTVQLCR